MASVLRQKHGAERGRVRRLRAERPGHARREPDPNAFTYVIQATWSVTVNIVAPPNAASLNIPGVPLLPGGGVAVDFSGIPGYIYGLQFDGTLADPLWQNLALVSADQFGRGHYVDGPPPVGSTSGFYRLISPYVP